MREAQHSGKLCHRVIIATLKVAVVAVGEVEVRVVATVVALVVVVVVAAVVVVATTEEVVR